jgi:hypothetical protein
VLSETSPKNALDPALGRECARWGKEATKAVAAGASALGGLISLFWLVWFLWPKTGEAEWFTLLKLVVALVLSFGVMLMMRFALSPLVAADPAPPTSAVDADVALRSRMAPIVLGIGSAAIILLAIGLMIAFSVLNQQKSVADKFDTLLMGIFASVLPVFATWVGTVIAFYFTNESFRQAAQAARESTAPFTDRLRSIPARTAMVPLARMVVLRLPVAGALYTTALKTIDDKFSGVAVGDNGVRISRLVILDSSDMFIGIIHRSIWMELLNKYLKQNQASNMGTDQLGPLINVVVGSGAPAATPSPPAAPATTQPAPAAPAASTPGTYSDIIRKAVAFIGVDQTLADAKSAMDAVPGCQDVIVTQGGAPTMAVIGWITNTDIGRLSQA